MPRVKKEEKWRGNDNDNKRGRVKKKQKEKKLKTKWVDHIEGLDKIVPKQISGRLVAVLSKVCLEYDLF